jgi:FkbM family methyltransferase
VRATVLSLLDRTPAPIAARLRSRASLSRAARPVVNYVLPREPREVTVRSGPARGIRMLVDLRREKFYWTGAYEPAVQAALARRLRPGMRVWDVGAHVGFFSLLAARLVGPTGEVHAFEPLPENCERLEHNARLNGFTNIVAHAHAVGVELGAATFYDHESTSMGSLVGDGTDVPSRVVGQTTLDALAVILASPTLIKIDVEGAELDVLRGGTKLFASEQPELIVEIDRRGGKSDLRAAVPHYAAHALGERHLLFGPGDQNG